VSQGASTIAEVGLLKRGPGVRERGALPRVLTLTPPLRTGLGPLSSGLARAEGFDQVVVAADGLARPQEG
jgi:hypothetical protein